MFSARYQPSLMPFVNHGIGTASILSSLGVPGPLMAAGVLHNVYWNGEFGDGTKGITEAKRRIVKDAVGEEMERYLAGFAALRWYKNTIWDIRDGIPDLGPFDRDVIVLKLADLLEKFDDLGALYQVNANDSRELAREYGPTIAEMAAALGYPALALELGRVFAETVLGEIPEELRNRTDSNVSVVILPRSHRKRLLPAIREWCFRRSLDKRRKQRAAARGKAPRAPSHVTP